MDQHRTHNTLVFTWQNVLLALFQAFGFEKKCLYHFPTQQCLFLIPVKTMSVLLLLMLTMCSNRALSLVRLEKSALQ